ncbi:MAG: arginine decarboxylase, pyruvoyl-dependent [Eubacteriales bacterium]|jgi:arginine decarboxylase|nr:arginine decarboxylase, pyruvoyl-dependent [Eubacteriales bacterium]HBI56248.1 arginine decarboxylase, pyruvoyl-dependent [Bacillota bacterium]MDD3073641.1 arginine decarboxylase, pyruvoyl-dependent [Eubacteriales bacterium]MDD4078943.1 arginine decarboxylase, pyruvoyl-dependent [Eubacteriales bacterium]MDD4769362.1 arginine decarboxylase, pyruvoyl-dependent [Eubacteriales bacterium]
MLPTPKKFKIVAGSAEGETLLNSFDNALLASGIGNVNLLRISSILPPESIYVPDLVLPPGSLVPTAYGYVISEKKGEKIAACVGIGFSENSFGVIMEYAAKGTREEAEEKIRQMLKNAFAVRDLALKDVKLASTEHVVERIGCAFAAVALWY